MSNNEHFEIVCEFYFIYYTVDFELWKWNYWQSNKSAEKSFVKCSIKIQMYSSDWIWGKLLAELQLQQIQYYADVIVFLVGTVFHGKWLA